MRFGIVAVGTSLGGFDALSTLLGGLPEDFALPIVVVQHRSIDDSETLSPMIAARCALPVREVEDKDRIRPGHVFLGPANYHVMVEGNQFSLSTDMPVRSARPSIDVLFESVADQYGSAAIGIILTGASKDGSRGLELLKRRGGHVIVQDPETAECPIMPQAAIATTPVDKVLRVPEIALYLDRLCRHFEESSAVDSRMSGRECKPDRARQ